LIIESEENSFLLQNQLAIININYQCRASHELFTVTIFLPAFRRLFQSGPPAFNAEPARFFI
jgi:hypothetical protein